MGLTINLRAETDGVQVDGMLTGRRANWTN